MEDIVGLALIMCIVGPVLFVPITAMVLKHRKEMLQIELERRRLSNQEIVAQIEALRQELAQLRDTSTQYDMSLQMNFGDASGARAYAGATTGGANAGATLGYISPAIRASSLRNAHACIPIQLSTIVSTITTSPPATEPRRRAITPQISPPTSPTGGTHSPNSASSTPAEMQPRALR
jgi:hypothetical protein